MRHRVHLPVHDLPAALQRTPRLLGAHPARLDQLILTAGAGGRPGRLTVVVDGPAAGALASRLRAAAAPGPAAPPPAAAADSPPGASFRWQADGAGD